MGGPGAHHKLGPSTLKYVEVCPGFRSTSEENVFTIEGTKMHEAAETGNFEGLDEEQEAMVSKALAYVNMFKTKGTKTLLEQRVNIRL
jgi:hypothetical protein